MFAANIKKPPVHNLNILEDIFSQSISLPNHQPVQPVKFTYYNFICTLIELLEEFIKSNLKTNFNIFLVDFYVSKKLSPIEIHRSFFGLTKAWKKFIEHHEDAKLFLSLLDDQRNTKQYIKWFLKLRKNILKNISSKILE